MATLELKHVLTGGIVLCVLGGGGGREEREREIVKGVDR